MSISQLDLARNTVQDLIKFQSPDILDTSRVGEIYLKCICCNTKRFNSIEDTRGNSDIYWCEPCSEKAYVLMRKISQNSDNQEWKTIGELFNSLLKARL